MKPDSQHLCHSAMDRWLFLAGLVKYCICLAGPLQILNRKLSYLTDHSKSKDKFCNEG